MFEGIQAALPLAREWERRHVREKEEKKDNNKSCLGVVWGFTDPEGE
jgi:hypothetical protein